MVARPQEAVGIKYITVIFNIKILRLNGFDW